MKKKKIKTPQYALDARYLYALSLIDQLDQFLYFNDAPKHHRASLGYIRNVFKDLHADWGNETVDKN